MWLVTSPRNDQHLQLFCEAGHAALYFTNQQCFWGDDGKYYIDVSVARGPAGHKYVYLIVMWFLFFSNLSSPGTLKTHLRRCVKTLKDSPDVEQSEISRET